MGGRHTEDKAKDITLEELRGKNCIEYEYVLNAKEFSQNTFWYYTSVNTANEILNKGSFWASNFENMNDEDEATLHHDCKDKVHALCFCNSSTEKIPMWYLYSGITGQGVRIGFTPFVMLQFIRNIDAVYPVINGKVSETSLKVGKDVDIQVGWVFYKKDSSVIRFKGKNYKVVDYNEKDFLSGNYFVKDYPWEYEREFRVVVINHTQTSYEKVAVKFSEDILSHLKITRAPECSSHTNLGTLLGFQKYHDAQIGKSTLHIKMNLLERNKREIVESITTLIDQDETTLLCRNLSQLGRCGSEKK